MIDLLVLASAHAFAGPTAADEIAARSGLPASEVNALLSDCDSSQTSMNFCAWRDQIVAERELQRIVDKQVSEQPRRKAALDAQMASGRKRATHPAKNRRVTHGAMGRCDLRHRRSVQRRQRRKW
ncbi:hypothetical protein JYG37_04520 [Burkholderia sp. LAS2]|nr:hypothetical protein JYG37_04520 [Burkholderia sp. LAS2]